MARTDVILQKGELQAITDHAEDFISLLDLELRYLFVNRAIAQQAGVPAETLVGRRMTELALADDSSTLIEGQMREVIATGDSRSFEHAIALPGGWRYLHTLLAPVKDGGAVKSLIAISRDVTDFKRTAALRDAQNEVMRGLASGARLDELLGMIVRLAEDALPGRLASVLLADGPGRRLLPGCAPHLPAELIEALCARGIDAANGACGAAADERRLVISDDTDPAWQAHRAVLQRHGLRGCWSIPVVDREGALLGTFAVYGTRPRAPHDFERQVLTEGALLAAVAIQQRRTLDSLLEVSERYAALADHAANIITVTDLDGVIRDTSPAIRSLLGYEPAEMIGRNAYDFVHADDAAAVRAIFRRLGQEVGTEAEATYRYRHKNGSWRVLETIAKSRLNHRGEYLAVVNSRDVTDHEEMTEALKLSEARLDRALSASGLGMWDWDVDSGRLFADPRCVEILGYHGGGFGYTIDFLNSIAHGDDARRSMSAVQAHARGETPHYEIELRVRSRGDEWKWVRLRGQVTVRDTHGQPLHITGTIQDIDGQRRVQESLDRANKRIQLLLEATGEGIIGLDAGGVISFLNPAAMRMLGTDVGREPLGRPLLEVVSHLRDDGVEIPREQTPVYRCLSQHERCRSGEDLVWRHGGHSIPVEYSVSPLLGEDGGYGAVLIVHDVSEKRAMAHQLQFQALHDPLTGLINRRGFESRLAELLASAKAESREHALAYIDLDQFKLVNDTCGHAAGDELLRQLPKVLQPLVRNRDVIARLGGDEFAILLQDCPLGKAAQIAESVRDAIRGFRFVWQYRSFTIGASIGVVGITAESQGIVSVLGAADTACYVAKDQGPNHVHVSYPHDLAIIRRRGEMRWVARLKSALEENRFCLHFQSIASFARSQLPPAHHELLIRLLDAKGELILPGAFIAAAERYQLMPVIDGWVVEHALRYVGEVIAPQPALRHHRFGINLSGESLRDGALLDTVRQTLARYRVPPTMLYFEITETAAISNLGVAVEFMRSLKQLGCQLALDDFGSGMSSFSYLKHLPVDYLKIDGSFVKDILNNPVDQAIVRAINSVGQKMGIRTIAEYVESPLVADALRAIGVDYAQGYAIAAPRPLEEFIQAFGTPVAASA